MLDHKFEKFLGGPSHRMDLKNKLRATINRRGMIYFNEKLFAELGSPPAVALYFNREEDQIAVRPAFDRSGDAFPVQKHQAGWVVRASTFCRHYRIRVAVTQEFLRPIIGPEKTLVLDLRETITVGGIDRTRGKQNKSAEFAKVARYA